MGSPTVDGDPLRRHADTMVPDGAEDFAVNVVPGGPPPWLRERLHAAIDGLGRYPDERRAVLAVAARHGRHPDEVVLTNGAAEGFALLAATLHPARAVCVHPSFTEPEAALAAHGHRVERVMRDPWTGAFDPGTVPQDADLVVLGNPNNPCGTLLATGLVSRLCRVGRTVVVDEAFMDFVPGEPESLAGRDDLPGLVVVRSLTKLWAIPGLRAGFLLAPPALAADLRARRPAWNVNALALEALIGCSERPWDAEEVARGLVGPRERLARGLAELPGVRLSPSRTNFLLARVPEGEAVRRRLLALGFAVRPAWTFPGLDDGCLRLTVRDDAANARLLDAMRSAMSR